jgi:hypothetical protein
MAEEELTAAIKCFKGKSLAGGPVRKGCRAWDTHGLTIGFNRGRHLQVLMVRLSSPSFYTLKTNFKIG